MKINTLTGELTGAEGTKPPSVSMAAVNEIAPEAMVNNPAVLNAVRLALAGQLPRARDLKSYELERLGVQHMQLIFDRAIGYTPGELQLKYDLSASHISTTLRHPDAEYILALIMGTLADRMTDPLERLKHHANEAINEVVSVMRGSNSEALRLKAAQDILNRSGYGEQRKVVVAADSGITLPRDIAASLSGALDASMRVRDIDYQKHMKTSSQAGDSNVLDAQSGKAATLVSGASPVARPVGEVTKAADNRPSWAVLDPPRLTSVQDEDLNDEARVA